MSTPSLIEGISPFEPISSGTVVGPSGMPVGLVAPAQNAAPSREALPPELADTVWRGDELSGGRAAFVPTGFTELDAELPDGGWPCGCLIEVLQAQPSLIEWRLVGPALRDLVSQRSIVTVGPPKRPHLAGLRHLGIDENRLVWIKAEAPSERLWVTEQLVRSQSAAAVLTWLPQARPEQLRRLQVLAQGCDGPVFVFRPAAARHDPSPAPLRLIVSTLVDWQLQVQILKRRGAALDEPLILSSIPGGLQHVLTSRTLKPSQLITTKEAPRHAVGRPAHLDIAPATVSAFDHTIDRAASIR